MGQTYYEIYRDEVLALARSVVIKNSFVATTINTSLKGLNFAVDEADLTTWKYYLNLNGQYHVSDTKMTVRSMDTLETIDFTQDNLKIHRATAREYVPGSVYYNSLVSRYPTQADLINGIISPVDLTKAINSQDGDILYYDPQYVEDNEDTFFYQLQSWVKVFFTRWFNEQFILIDDLYLAGFIGQLYMHMPMAMMMIRLRNCKTNRAHSFHIREYLASNNRLDQYIPYLTKAQQLWLYRNIQYLKRNAGKQFIWDRLVTNVLTARGIPIIDYTLEQNAANMPANRRPDVELVKHDINGAIVQPGYSKVDINTLLTRENALARENAIVQYDAEQTLTEKMQSDQFSTLPTKVLDSEVIDRGNSNIRSLEQFLLNEWIYLAGTNRYRSYVTVVNPSTGEYMTLNVRDALVVTLYAYARTRDLDVDTVPTCIAYEVLRPKLPEYNELASIVDLKYCPPKMIQKIMDMITPLTEYISTEAFYKDVYNLYLEYTALWELYSFQEHYMSRVYCQQVVERHFMHIKVPLVTEPTSYEQYFKDLGIEITTLTNADLDSLLTEVIKVATGANLVTVVTLGEIQAQLLRLMGDMTSYPLQYLRNVSSTDYTIMGIPDIRLGDQSASTASTDRVNVLDFGVQNYRGRTAADVDLYDALVQPTIVVEASTVSHYVDDPLVDVREVWTALGNYKLNISDVGIRGVKFTATFTPGSDGQLMEYDPLF